MSKLVWRIGWGREEPEVYGWLDRDGEFEAVGDDRGWHRAVAEKALNGEFDRSGGLDVFLADVKKYGCFGVEPSMEGKYQLSGCAFVSEERKADASRHFIILDPLSPDILEIVIDEVRRNDA